MHRIFSDSGKYDEGNITDETVANSGGAAVEGGGPLGGE